MAACQAVAQILFSNTVHWLGLRDYSSSFYLLSPSPTKSFIYGKIEKQLLWSGGGGNAQTVHFFFCCCLILHLGSIPDEISRITSLLWNARASRALLTNENSSMNAVVFRTLFSSMPRKRRIGVFRLLFDTVRGFASCCPGIFLVLGSSFNLPALFLTSLSRLSLVLGFVLLQRNWKEVEGNDGCGILLSTAGCVPFETLF